MASRPPGRSVKIGEDERTGYSSDRPRRSGGPARPPDLRVNTRVLTPADRLRYSPGSLLIVCCASSEQLEAFLERLIEDRSSLLTRGRVLKLLAGRVPEDQLESRADELLKLTVAKRLENRQTVVLGLQDMSAATREPYLAKATEQRRPRHLILLEVPRELVDDEALGELNELRRALDAGELGAEGIQTALRLGGGTAEEVKRILFRPPPRETD
ncbi:MAG TPA: hypothetical protein VMB91_04575 [Solirubrobacteraceae bacterium]|nr:hypothetical protein [Solirubrobacteraceae bacterium]